MEKGWPAKGLLEPLWQSLPGKRTELAAVTGIRPETLSSYNSGKRPLGMGNAEKIADALSVSVYDLGAPRPRDGDFALSLLGRICAEVQRNAPATPPDLLRELATELRDLARTLEAVASSRDNAEPPA